VKLGIVSEFDAAHRLPGYNGKCSRIHGHTYKVEVVLEGPVNENSGFVIDFFELKSILSSALEKLDHGDLNQVLPNPTAEMIAEYISSGIKARLGGLPIRLISTKLWEGKNKWVMVE
jgi:6-pyruvoyltetrahydropterin/6-carboxytetrahydropterin synthase